jgi:hypothetical protein
MELLPYNYKFRMNYAKGSNEKYQDVGVNPTAGEISGYIIEPPGGIQHQRALM